MVQLLVLSKCLERGSVAFLESNGLDKTYFTDYPQVFDFIFDYKRQYGKVPSIEIVSAKYPEFAYTTTNDSDEYLLRTIKEEHLFRVVEPIIKKSYGMLADDSIGALEYLRGNLAKLDFKGATQPVDLIKDADQRYNKVEFKLSNDEPNFIPTGLKELDKIIYGWSRGEELATIVGRTGQGKTWVLVMFLVNAWLQGANVGMYSGEMTSDRIGYRFDTLLKHFSNAQLVQGTLPKLGEYKEYIGKLKTNDNHFFVSTPITYGGKYASVSNLENFVDECHLDILGVDQYSLMRDERAGKYDKANDALEHISSDLFELSKRKGLPIIALSQSNREGDDKRDGPDTVNIYGSDAIGQNSTKIISIRQKGDGIEFSVKKNRDGDLGTKLTYTWDIDKGVMTYNPTIDDMGGKVGENGNGTDGKVGDYIPQGKEVPWK